MSFTQQDLKFFSKTDAKRLNDTEYLIEEGQYLVLRVKLLHINESEYCVSIGTRGSTRSYVGTATTLQSALRKAYEECDSEYSVVKDLRDSTERLFCQSMEK